MTTSWISLDDLKHLWAVLKRNIRTKKTLLARFIRRCWGLNPSEIMWPFNSHWGLQSTNCHVNASRTKSINVTNTEIIQTEIWKHVHQVSYSNLSKPMKPKTNQQTNKMSSQKCLKKLIDYKQSFIFLQCLSSDARGNVHWKNARSPESPVFSHTLSLEKTHQNNNYEN